MRQKERQRMTLMLNGWKHCFSSFHTQKNINERVCFILITISQTINTQQQHSDILNKNKNKCCDNTKKNTVIYF